MLSPELVCLDEHGHAVDGARWGACIGRASEKGGVRGWVGIARGFIGRVDEAYFTRFSRPKDGTVSGIALQVRLTWEQLDELLGEVGREKERECSTDKSQESRFAGVEVGESGEDSRRYTGLGVVGEQDSERSLFG